MAINKTKLGKRKKDPLIPTRTPLMGIELETIPDADNQFKVMGRWNKNAKIEHLDAMNVLNQANGNTSCYGVLIADTSNDDNSFSDKRIFITLDTNNIFKTSSTRTGGVALEFVSSPIEVSKETPIENNEYFLMVDHFSKFMAKQVQEMLLKSTQLNNHTTRTSQGQDHTFRVEEWIDEYNADNAKNTETLQELYKVEHKTASTRTKGILEPLLVISEKALRKALEQYSTLFYPHINLSIPAEHMFSEEMRALTPDKTECTFIMPQTKNTPEYVTMRPRKKFLQFEQEIYTQAMSLAKQKEKDIPDERLTPRIKGFLRTIAYTMALQTVSENTLKSELKKDMKINEKITTSNPDEIIDILGKDLYPKGMPKFRLNDFYHDMLDDAEKSTIKEYKDVIITLCDDAIEITNKKDCTQPLVRYNANANVKTPQDIITAKLFDNIVLSKDYVTTNNDYMPQILSKHIPCKNNTGVVELRDVMTDNYDLEAVINVVNECKNKYLDLFDDTKINEQSHKKQKISHDTFIPTILTETETETQTQIEIEIKVKDVINNRDENDDRKPAAQPNPKQNPEHNTRSDLTNILNKDKNDSNDKIITLLNTPSQSNSLIESNRDNLSYINQHQNFDLQNFELQNSFINDLKTETEQSVLKIENAIKESTTLPQNQLVTDLLEQSKLHLLHIVASLNAAHRLSTATTFAITQLNTTIQPTVPYAQQERTAQSVNQFLPAFTQAVSKKNPPIPVPIKNTTQSNKPLDETSCQELLKYKNTFVIGEKVVIILKKNCTSLNNRGHRVFLYLLRNCYDLYRSSNNKKEHHTTIINAIKSVLDDNKVKIYTSNISGIQELSDESAKDKIREGVRMLRKLTSESHLSLKNDNEKTWVNKIKNDIYKRLGYHEAILPNEQSNEKQNSSQATIVTIETQVNDAPNNIDGNNGIANLK